MLVVVLEAFEVGVEPVPGPFPELGFGLEVEEPVVGLGLAGMGCILEEIGVAVGLDPVGDQEVALLGFGGPQVLGHRLGDHVFLEGHSEEIAVVGIVREVGVVGIGAVFRSLSGDVLGVRVFHC